LVPLLKLIYGRKNPTNILIFVRPKDFYKHKLITQSNIWNWRWIYNIYNILFLFWKCCL